MTILLSLLTAMTFGAGDFAGGLATRRARVVEVVVGAHFIGLIGVTIAALVLADEFHMGDFGRGAIGGLFGLLGLALLYRRLAVGPMAVVAPVTAIMSAAVPAAWGLFSGESLTQLTAVGVALAFVAVGLVSMSDEVADAPITAELIRESLLAGASFGAFFILLDTTNASSAPWPVVGSRVASVVVLAVVIGGLWQRGRWEPRGLGRHTWNLIAVAGGFDVLANVLFLYATNRGDLTLVAVLSSLYPAVTAVLARLVLHERINRRQSLGFVAAVIATALISAGSS